MNMRKTFVLACAIAASLTQAIELNKGTQGAPSLYSQTDSKSTDSSRFVTFDEVAKAFEYVHQEMVGLDAKIREDLQAEVDVLQAENETLREQI